MESEMVNICHIIGFKLDSCEEAYIDKSFRIRKLLRDELEILENILYTHHKEFLIELKTFQLCIENKDLDSAKFSSYIEKLVIAMCLFSGKAVTKGALIFYNPKKLPFFNSKLSPRSKCRGAYWQSTDSQMKTFIKFWNAFKNMTIDSSDIGIRYLKEAMYSETAEDRLIKITIAMERILLPKERIELRDKFSTRAALILENKLGERQKIKNFFKDIYDLRSNIVHGRKVKVKKEIYKEYFDNCRKIICIFIENKSNWNKEMLEDISLGENKLKYNFAMYIEE